MSPPRTHRVQPRDPRDQDVHQETVLCFLCYSLLFKYKKTLIICLFYKREIFTPLPGHIESNHKTPKTKVSIMRLCSAFYTILYYSSTRWEIFTPPPRTH